MKKVILKIFLAVILVMAVFAPTAAFAADVTIDNCDTTTNWERSKRDLYKYLEGTACIGSIPCVDPYLKCNLDAALDTSSLNESSTVLVVNVYFLSDNSCKATIDGVQVGTEVRLGNDEDYYYWTISSAKGREWHTMTFALSEAQTKGSPAFNNITFFSINPPYIEYEGAKGNATESVVKVDDIYLTDDFQQKNYVETNNTITIDKIQDTTDYYGEIVTDTETISTPIYETVEVPAGLSTGAIIGIVAAAVVVVAGAAVAIILVSKKKNKA